MFFKGSLVFIVLYFRWLYFNKDLYFAPSYKYILKTLSIFCKTIIAADGLNNSKIQTKRYKIIIDTQIFSMFKRILSKSEKPVLLVLDLASTRLKVMLVSLQANAQQQYPILELENIKHKLSFTQVIDGEFEDLRKQLTQLLVQMYKKNTFDIKHCVFGLEDSFFQASFYTASFQMQGQALDNGALQNILQNSFVQAKTQAQAKAQTKFKDSSLHLIQADLVDLRVDNQSVNNPLGLKANHLTTIFFNAFCQKKLYKSLSCLADYVGFKLDSIYLQPVSQAILSQDHGKSLIIEIGHSKTTVTLAKDGRLLKTHKIEFSTQNIIDDLAKRFKVDQQEALKILLAYCKDEYLKEYRDLRKYILINSNKLVAKIHKQILDLKLFDLKDVSIFLMGGGAMIPEVTELLESKTSSFGVCSITNMDDFPFLSDPFSLIQNSTSSMVLAYASKFFAQQSADKSSFAKANIDQILRLTTNQ